MSTATHLDIIQAALRANIPALIWGGPGLGKTATVMQLSEALGLHTEVVIASVREPSDFGGLPLMTEKGVVLEPPAWARRLAQHQTGLLFLDEISTVPPAVQAALLRVVLDRVVGELPLPPGIRIIAAANPAEVAAGGWDLAPPLANRFIHVTWNLEPSKWTEGFVTYWSQLQQESETRRKRAKAASALRELTPASWARARSMVAGFIHRRPTLLFQMPESESQRGKAWPSPRSWDMASRLLGIVLDDGLPTLEALPYVAAAVGEGAAMEFSSWLREANLPDPEELLRDPSRYEHPNRGDLVYAVLSSVTQAALNDLTAARWKAAWQVIGMAAKAGGKDVAAVAAHQLAKALRGDLPMPPEVKLFDRLLKQLSKR